jgi:hypothetical protein
MVQIKQRG